MYFHFVPLEYCSVVFSDVNTLLNLLNFLSRLGLAVGTGKMEGAVVCAVGGGEDSEANVSDPPCCFSLASSLSSKKP